MSRISELVSKIKEGRLGFLMDEVMIGEHEFEPGFGEPGKKYMEYRSTWGPDNIADWINPQSETFLIQDLTGFVTIEGLCTDTPCKGKLELKYFDEHRIRYSFEFKVKGKNYRYVGEKVNIKPWNLPISHTTCFGTLTEKTTGKLVSKSVTYFKFSKALGFLLSLRLQ